MAEQAVAVAVPVEAVEEAVDAGVGGVTAGEWGEQGRRPSMEDRSVAAALLRPAGVDGTYTMHAVFDGHGGDEAAAYAEKHMAVLVERFLVEGEAPGQALAKAFVECDRAFLEETRTHAGTTAVVLLLHHESRTAWVANAGDSRAVLCRAGDKTGAPLSEDHKATLPSEVARIRKAGGFVINGRVMGELAVTRAIGDKELKLEAEGLVLPDPEVLSRELGPDDAAVVLACDGVFDVMNNDAVAAFVLERAPGGPAASPAGATAAARELTRHATQKLGSGDNATAVVVLLGGLY